MLTISIDAAWLAALRLVLATGDEICPRGKKTLEMPQYTMVVDTRQPVLTIPERALGYRFMAAEARWILNADDRVATISPYSKRIADFSDDGKTFFGAYGPRIFAQLPGLIDRLAGDPDSRQAVLTTWRENPPLRTKDVPCTVAIGFQIRNNRVNAHVYMRSNDLWLGTPYDVFNFSMLTHLVTIFINRRRTGDAARFINHNKPINRVSPGALYLTAASSHIYEENFEPAKAIVDKYRNGMPAAAPVLTPSSMFENDKVLDETLLMIMDAGTDSAARWWTP